MKKTFLPFIAFVLITSIFFACQKESTLPDNLNTDKNPVIGTDDRASYVIPAGSINALAAALQDYSTVILAPGIHTEDGPVTVSGYKKIIGQDGAVLRVNTTPFVNPEVPLQVALHLDHASGSAVHGLIIESSTPVGGTGILVENSTKVSIQNCKLRNFQFSILVEKSPLVNIHQNIIEASTAWQTGEISEGHGIVIINGAGARITNNDISGALFGCWACDKNGAYRNNNTHDNYLGLILCKVPTPALLLPNGTWTGAQYSAANWTVKNNESHHNLTTGYLVIDGANNNYLYNNNANDNGTYDYELVGDSYRFGFLTPFCFNNRLEAKAGQTVKDCGQNNTITGGIWINTATDPCN